MTRGYRGGYSSSRGSSSYRGSSSRGSSFHSHGRGGYSSRGGGGGGGRFPSSSYSSNSYDSRKYSHSDKFGSSSRRDDDYRHKSYKNDSGYPSQRDRSPARKRMRPDSSHDRNIGGGGSGDYKNRYEPDRRSFSNERRSSSFARKEEFRKPPPPPSSPRGGYRGRVSSRGPLRSRLRERPVRRRLVESSYNVRRRVISGRTSDYARRLKISRLRSSIASRSKKDSPEKSNDDADDVKKSIKEEDSSDAKINTEPDTDAKKSPKKSPKREKDDDDDNDNSDEKDGTKTSDNEDDSKSSSSVLACPHCHTKCTSIGKYSIHLQSRRHVVAMRRLATKQKNVLSQMRLVQRDAQRELERTTSDLAPRTSWCPLCKLNYKQPKATHQASAAHLEMKKFLMPRCKVCRITFKSPMVYESHCCSVDHLERANIQKSNRTDKEDSGNEDDALESFTTIDSVGDIDGIESSEKKEADEKPLEQVNVGIESIRKVEVHYCDLCRMYLTRVSDEAEAAKIIAQHCKQRTHLQKYIRHKEDKELAKKAERLVRKETEQKEKQKAKEESPKEAQNASSAKAEKNGNINDDSNVDEEKPWADSVEGGNKSSDEDEEDSVVNGERYDRFRGSEKMLEEKKEAAAIKEEAEVILEASVIADDTI